jgi:hypothetical protein
VSKYMTTNDIVLLYQQGSRVGSNAMLVETSPIRFIFNQHNHKTCVSSRGIFELLVTEIFWCTVFQNDILIINSWTCDA